MLMLTIFLMVSNVVPERVLLVVRDGDVCGQIAAWNVRTPDRGS